MEYSLERVGSWRSSIRLIPGSDTLDLVLDLSRLLRSEYDFDLVATREDGRRAVQRIQFSLLPNSTRQSLGIHRPRMVPDNLDAEPIEYELLFDGDTLSESQEPAFSFSTVDPDSKVVTPSLADISGIFALEGSTLSDTWSLVLASPPPEFDQLKDGSSYGVTITLEDSDYNQTPYTIIIKISKKRVESQETESVEEQAAESGTGSLRFEAPAGRPSPLVGGGVQQQEQPAVRVELPKIL